MLTAFLIHCLIGTAFSCFVMCIKRSRKKVPFAVDLLVFLACIIAWPFAVYYIASGISASINKRREEDDR